MPIMAMIQTKHEIMVSRIRIISSKKETNYKVLQKEANLGK
jgi:hypothetical protein